MADLVTVMVYMTAAFLLSTHFSPYILDIIAPLNESRPLVLRQFQVELFVDEEQYYHVIMLLIDLISFFGSTVIMASESLLILFFYHIVGLFRITR